MNLEIRNAGARGISFILPVTLHEKRNLVDGGLSWRHAPDDCCRLRVQLMIASFLRFFSQEDLCEFKIVCPEYQMEVIKGMLRSLTTDYRYQVVSETELIGALSVGRASEPNAGTLPVSGWIVQQIIKIAAAAQLHSEHYVTLDSDIICLKHFSFGDLIEGGRAWTNIETRSDYDRLYIDSFSEAEYQLKSQRCQCSALALGYTRSAAMESVFYGETPVVFHTASMIALSSHITKRFKRPWIEALAGRDCLKGWTEISLYFLFLEMTGQLDSLCVRADCNRVLDLEKSVWHESRYYREARVYDQRHFMEDSPKRGPFVAVQSWLPTRSWLPKRCDKLSEFYAELKGMLL